MILPTTLSNRLSCAIYSMDQRFGFIKKVLICSTACTFQFLPRFSSSSDNVLLSTPLIFKAGALLYQLRFRSLPTRRKGKYTQIGNVLLCPFVLVRDIVLTTLSFDAGRNRPTQCCRS
ncbi:hypothetical protein PILCRDRAFT_824402 [Piloderma croceum F 1598]|uniref:Uncharacterized protein n=1 Tax=Piloderma croceum (strain F 1598) TaxID=765440 RepID=A0A0C3AWW0_PILCF|nr:hypothetical protein PILCRDRAFT_824402 [Piloderma croceum F 1598]